MYTNFLRNPVVRILIILPFLLSSMIYLKGQGLLDGYVSGSLESRVNFYIRDEQIGAAGTPQYDNQLTSIDGWLNVQYFTKDFDIGIRYDLFENTNLKDPSGSYTGQGIGRWWVHKKIAKLDITGGYIYDQIGVGSIFRSYEERPLFIDNALAGIQLKYEISPNWNVRVFGGQQKKQFDLYSGNIKGGSIDGYISIGNGENPLNLSPGFGMVNRTLGDDVVQKLVDEVSLYPPDERDGIEIKYNTNAYSLYNTLTSGPFVWYIEGAYKSNETMFDPEAERDLGNGTTTLGKLFNASGTIFYTSFSYAKSGLGITLEGKRIENFSFRTDPTLTANDGRINFLPSMARINTYRLTARYNPASQDLGELAFQGDIRYSIKRKWNFNLNYAHINDLEDNLLYREVYATVQWKQKRKWLVIGGIQHQVYNQAVYEVKPGVPNVETITPFAEVLYRFQPRKSIRLELQYMNTEEDYGSWLFALLEVGLAPNWIFTVSDMYNVDPKKTGKLHYPTAEVVYSHKANRFSLAYVKQVEGVVCSGGICRLEPAFSGVRFTVNSSF